MLEPDKHGETPSPANSIFESQKTAPAAKRRIQSVDRAIDILEILAAAHDGLALKDIARRASLNPATCHHLIATLVHRNFVAHVHSSRSYHLGPRLVDLCDKRLRQFSILELALPELHELNETTRESIQLAVIRGSSLTTLASLDSRMPVRAGFADEASRAEAAHATAIGKAILAWLPEPEIVRVAGRGALRTFTERTIPNSDALLDHLRMVRRNGIAVEEEEFQCGVVCVAAAIRDQFGAVIGSVGATMPGMRAGGDHLDRVVRDVKECASRISSRLGDSTHDTEKIGTTGIEPVGNGG